MIPKNIRPYGFWVFLLLLNLACHSYGSMNAEAVIINETSNSFHQNETGSTVETYSFDLPLREFPTDTSGKIVYPVIGSDRALLSTDATGVHIDVNGEPINIHSNGLPLGPDGDFLPTDSLGQFIYPDPPPTDFANKSVIVIICPGDPPPYPTDKNGDILNFDGSPFPTNIMETPIDSNESTIPEDKDGSHEPQILPTNPSEINFTDDNLHSSSGDEVYALKEGNPESILSNEMKQPPNIINDKLVTLIEDNRKSVKRDSAENQSNSEKVLEKDAQDKLYSFLEFFYNIHY